MELQVGMMAERTYWDHPGEGRLESLLKVLETQPDLDILLAPEWYLLPAEGGMYSLDDFQKIKASLEERTRSKELLLIPGSLAWLEKGEYRNTALVISHGKTILTYSKRANGGDRVFAKCQGVSFLPGDEKGLFRWRDFSCGIEICRDHGYLKREDWVRNLDLQFLISNGGSPADFLVALRPGGFIFYCDGFSGDSYCYYVAQYLESRATKQGYLKKKENDYFFPLSSSASLLRRFKLELEV